MVLTTISTPDGTRPSVVPTVRARTVGIFDGPCGPSEIFIKSPAPNLFRVRACSLSQAAAALLRLARRARSGDAREARRRGDEVSFCETTGERRRPANGKNDARILNWRERLKIALDSAQGLEYLHSGCKRPVIHRDVKTANILLTERFEAKIADFGISKVLPNDMQTHVSTRVVGTQGYLDPEYYTTHRLSDKSDVYSFGVVLLELITGQPPILPAPESSHVLHWVSQRLSRGNIDHVADTRLQGEYNENSMWKCVEVALKCTAPSSHQRPTMSEVVKHLKASLELETPHDRTGNMSSNTESLYTAYTNTSQNSSGKEKHSGKAPAAGIFAAM